MFCPNCGKQLPPNARFCSTCGAPQTGASEPQASGAPQSQTEYAPKSQPQPAPPPPPNPAQGKPASGSSEKKPGRKWNKLLLIIPAAAVIAALLVILNFTALSARVAPGFALSRGFDKLSGALEERRESGPASIPPTLSGFWQEGSFSLSGELVDEYNNEIAFSGDLLTAQNGKEIMLNELTVEDSYSNEAATLSVYLSSEALALRQRDLGNEWYGFHLNRPLAQQNADYLFFGPKDTASLQLKMDVLRGFLSTSEDPAAMAIAEDLGEVFADFLANSKPGVSGRKVAGENATVLTYRFSAKELSMLADSVFEVLLEEEHAQDLAVLFFFLDGYSYYTDEDVEHFTSALKDAREEVVSQLRSQIKGNIALSFALAGDGTLIQIACAGELTNEEFDDSVALDSTLSFGANPAKSGATTFTLTAEDGDGERLTLSLTSAASGNGLNGVNQIISFEFDDGYDQISMVLSTDWNPSTKGFALSFTSEANGKEIVLLDCEGALAISGSALALELEDVSYSTYDYWYDEMYERLRGSFQLSARAGSSIQPPDFENFFEEEMVYRQF